MHASCHRIPCLPRCIGGTSCVAETTSRPTRNFSPKWTPHRSLSNEAAAQLADPRCWGGALQIRIAACRWSCTIHVHSSDMPTQSFGTGPSHWHLAYHSGQGPGHRADHYDVLVPMVPHPCPEYTERPTQQVPPRPHAPEKIEHMATQRSQSALKRKTKLKLGELKIITANIGGARNSILHLCTMEVDVLMIQEHKLDATAMHSTAKSCYAAGWHGIWTEAESSVSHHLGRSGGVAILVRKHMLVTQGPGTHFFTERAYLSRC